MNCKTWAVAAAGALTLFSGGFAAAADRGFYFAASVGKASEDAGSNGTNVGAISFPGNIVHVEPDSIAVDDGSLAWSIGVGYRLNKYLSAEVEYIDFGKADITEHYDLSSLNLFPFPDEFHLDYSSKVTGPAMSLLGTLPVGRDFNLFVRGGVLFADREIELGNVYVSTSSSITFGSTVWLAGAGGSWSIARNWVLRAEYQRTGELSGNTISGGTQLDRVSLGVIFRL